MWFVDEHDEECLSYIAEQRFTNLNSLELVKIPKLTKWVGNGPSGLFSHLKVLIIKDCLELIELPFSHRAGHEQEEDTNMTWGHSLRLELPLHACTKLLSSLGTFLVKLGFKGHKKKFCPKQKKGQKRVDHGARASYPAVPNFLCSALHPSFGNRNR